MLLNVHSYYSLRYGTISPKELVALLLSLGYNKVVLTDINTSSGTLDFIRVAKEEGLCGLAGIEFRDGDNLQYIGIAHNPEGFRELNETLSEANFAARPVSDTPPEWEHVSVVFPYGTRTAASLKENEYLGVRSKDLNKIVRDPKKDWERYVIWQPLSFHQEQYLLHKQLRAISHNILFSQLGPAQIASPDQIPLSRVELLQKYREFPELIRNTETLLDRCSFEFDFKAPKTRKIFTNTPANDRRLLRKLSEDGFIRRYGVNPPARQRMERELELIHELNFSGYFLMTDDICRYARHRGFHYVGRGSGANSLIAYCLGITDVCPMELQLPFERFLNPKRKIPPDFDIDFSWDERDEIYDYLFSRYAEGHIALLGAMSTFRSRSILRELGKIYGLPKAEIDRLVHDPEHILNRNEVTDTIQAVYNQLEDFPNQRTIHASGILISELPLTYYGAMDMPPKGLPTMQFDMYVAEDIGFDKFDVLSQRGLGHIKDCRALVKENQGKTITTDQVRNFFTDAHIAAQLKSANTIGCFYIESPAMRQLLTKLRCEDYLTLVAASSIIRPGVASSGMMRAFIERHHDPSKAIYPHPIFKEQLEETYGVMVYQEDVMKIGHHYGGLDMADADVLRRMMSGKYRHQDHLIPIEGKFFDHCQAMGYPEETSRDIWRQMGSFAGYSFNKAHSASYAVESYQSLYLKTYFPLEFMVSVLNNYGGFYPRKVYVNEARKAGGNIQLPCVNKSVFGTTIYGQDIYLGFDCLLNLNENLARHIPVERQQNGPYHSLENFMLRTDVSLEQTIILIRCGALRFTGIGKNELLWEAHLLRSGYQEKQTQHVLFQFGARKPVLPPLESSWLEDMYDEIELIGFAVSTSAFDLAKSDFRGEIMAADMLSHEGQTIRMVGDYVAEKYVRTKNGKLMKFGTFFDQNGDFFDTVHFPPSLTNYPLRGQGLYLLEGKIVVDFGCPSLEVTRCGRMPLKHDPRS